MAASRTDRIARTPWQRVYDRFAIASQAEFARLLGRDRSKICRALNDPEGLINGRDQKLILDLARRENVEIDPADMMPSA